MSEPLDNAKRRKNEHLRLALQDSSVQRPGRGNGLERYDFEMLSMPELDLDRVDLSCTALGKTLRGPLMIGAMTGGTVEAGALNEILAEAAERCQVGFCLGSQRSMLNGDEEVLKSFRLREHAPTTLICGNIGGVQLRDNLNGEALSALAETVGADAMYIHLNALQEAVQPEGDRDWRGVYAAIAEAAGTATVPVLVKEVGAGLGAASLQALAVTGVAGVETAGVGGTSWARIEALRHTARTPSAIAGTVLAGFGTPTATSVRLARHAFPSRLVVASGGLRDGLEVAKCVALGADLAAMAYPFLVAARMKSSRADAVNAVVNEIEGVLETLRVTMFLVGAPSLSHLRTTPLFERDP